MSLPGLLMALLLLAAGGAILRRSFRAARPENESHLSDEVIRRIEEEGRIEVDEPLDWDEIRAGEEEFWGETWDEPEEL